VFVSVTMLLDAPPVFVNVIPVVAQVQAVALPVYPVGYVKVTVPDEAATAVLGVKFQVNVPVAVFCAVCVTEATDTVMLVGAV